jgi:ABC-type maltose transport system permease subunit
MVVLFLVAQQYLMMALTAGGTKEQPAAACR